MATLERQQGPLQPQVQAGAAAGGAGAAGGWGAGAVGGYGQPITMGGAGGGGMGGDPRQQAVIAAFEADRDKDEGTHVNAVVAAVSHRGLSRDEVLAIVEGLCTEGVLYTTVDEYHYRLTS